jgi:hypothetical protein
LVVVAGVGETVTTGLIVTAPVVAVTEHPRLSSTVTEYAIELDDVGLAVAPGAKPLLQLYV